MSKRLRATKKTRSKLTFRIPDSVSEESSLDENYLDNYSTESEYSDSKLQEPEEFSSGEELPEVSARGPPVRLFPSEDHKEEECSQDRQDKYFMEAFKSEKMPSTSDLASVFKSKAKGDFALHDFTKKPSSSQHHGQSGPSSRVMPPDPKSVPEAVFRLRNKEDLVKNRKVMDYLNQLEAAEEDVNSRLEANVEVSAKEIEDLQASRNAILKQFGYNIEDEAELKRNERKARRREKRKNEFPSGVSVSSSSESEDSERLLKEEVSRRVLNGQGSEAEMDFADLIKHSPQWLKSVEEEMTGNDLRGGIETMTKLTDRIYRNKTNC
ncbi:hypothetical protein GE061_010841 [Apolygus lucorum]|uniref:Uncharacterized protein n=1 Tax=Apolygus lucorum TaxID=248454 RepID=A0A6A4JRE4_APOLU|nr:hypothetical protein GE061_010841 [Apolygus lucorum]